MASASPSCAPGYDTVDFEIAPPHVFCRRVGHPGGVWAFIRPKRGKSLSNLVKSQSTSNTAVQYPTASSAVLMHCTTELVHDAEVEFGDGGGGVIAFFITGFILKSIIFSRIFSYEIIIYY